MKFVSLPSETSLKIAARTLCSFKVAVLFFYESALWAKELENDWKRSWRWQERSRVSPPKTYSTRGVQNDAFPRPPNLTRPLTSWPQKLIVSPPWPVVHFCQFPPKSVNLFSKYPVYKISNGWTDRRTDMSRLLPSLDRRRHTEHARTHGAVLSARLGFFYKNALYKFTVIIIINDCKRRNLPCLLLVSVYIW